MRSTGEWEGSRRGARAGERRRRVEEERRRRVEEERRGRGREGGEREGRGGKEKERRRGVKESGIVWDWGCSGSQSWAKRCTLERPVPTWVPQKDEGCWLHLCCLPGKS